jgi:DNA-directed RNA polymerase specialized sigma24 family protein
MSATVAFDFNEVVPKVQRAYSRANRDDAEEAVQVAVAELLARGKPLTAANVVQGGRHRLMDAFRRREKGNVSLDAFREEDVDQAPLELAVEEVDFEAHAELAAAARNPVLARRLANAQTGAAELRPRGARRATRGVGRSDETVALARRMRAEERLSFAEIGRRLGIPWQTIHNWCTGRARRAPEGPGWTRELIVAAIRAVAREDGKMPNSETLKRDPRLPCTSTFYRHFATWREAVAAV